MNAIHQTLVLIKGAGDLATGVAARLFRCGFPVAMTELRQPLMVRRTVAFGEAVYEGEVFVEDITARRVEDAMAARQALTDRVVPVLVDPDGISLRALQPRIVVDAIMAKRNTGTSLHQAPLVIALGPGFTAGMDCHAVIETNRGHYLGRVITEGAAEPDTGRPGNIAGKTDERILRAPVAGAVDARVEIGDRVMLGQVVASIYDHDVVAGVDGVLRGLVRPGAHVHAGEKIGDVDPRAAPEHCHLISDKSLASAGGVLEAILRLGDLRCA
jgi:xanthine dehydrogenase accessory factor